MMKDEETVEGTLNDQTLENTTSSTISQDASISPINLQGIIYL